jgi:hypothetical protein
MFPCVYLHCYWLWLLLLWLWLWLLLWIGVRLSSVQIFTFFIRYDVRVFSRSIRSSITL